MIARLFDPLVRLLLLAILLASFVPVTGEGRFYARLLSDGAIFLLFFLNGLRLPRGEVLSGMSNLRFLLPLIAWCFGAMGLLGWFFADYAAFSLPPTVALGFLFLGLLPTTVQSGTAYCSLANGNVAASVIGAAALNILGVFLTAPLLALVAGGDAVSIDLAGLQRIATILLLPFALGQLLQGRLGAWVGDNKLVIIWADRAAIAIAVYVAFSAAVVQGLWTLISLPQWALLLGLVTLFLTFGFLGAWWLSGALKLKQPDRIAFLFGGAHKSVAMGAPLASVLFPPAEAGLILLPLLVYHLSQLVISAPIAARFNPPD